MSILYNIVCQWDMPRISQLMALINMHIMNSTLQNKYPGFSSNQEKVIENQSTPLTYPYFNMGLFNNK